MEAITCHAQETITCLASLKAQCVDKLKEHNTGSGFNNAHITNARMRRQPESTAPMFNAGNLGGKRFFENGCVFAASSISPATLNAEQRGSGGRCRHDPACMWAYIYPAPVLPVPLVSTALVPLVVRLVRW